MFIKKTMILIKDFQINQWIKGEFLMKTLENENLF